MGRRATEHAVAEAAPLARRAGRGGRAARARAAPARPQDPFVGELRRRGLLPLLVLHLLGAGPSYGNELMERVRVATGGLVAVNPNTMYPLLRRLEEDGLVVGGVGAPRAPLAALLPPDGRRRGRARPASPPELVAAPGRDRRGRRAPARRAGR